MLFLAANWDWFFKTYETLGGLPTLGLNPSHLVFMMVPYIVTTVFVYHVAIKPILHVIEAREARTEGARAEAAELEEKFTERLKAYEARLALTRQTAADERARIRKEGGAQEEKILHAAHAEAAKAVDDVRAVVATKRERVRADLRKQAEQLAHELAEKALGREIGSGSTAAGRAGSGRAGATS